MAATSDEIQAELTLERGIVSKDETIDATYRMLYVTSGAGGPQAGKSCWCRTTIAETAANQVAEIITALTTPGPVDPNLA